MAKRRIEESSDISMIGPYLSTYADCPFCNTRNVSLFTESRASPVKPVTVCAHVRARIRDEDGINWFEFDTEPPVPEQQEAGAEA